MRVLEPVRRRDEEMGVGVRAGGRGERRGGEGRRHTPESGREETGLSAGCTDLPIWTSILHYAILHLPQRVGKERKMAEHWHTTDNVNGSEHVHTSDRQLVDYLNGCGVGFLLPAAGRRLVHTSDRMDVRRCEDADCAELAEEFFGRWADKAWREERSGEVTMEQEAEGREVVRVYVRKARDGEGRTVGFRRPAGVSSVELLEAGYAMDGSQAVKEVKLGELLEVELELVNLLAERGHRAEFE